MSRVELTEKGHRVIEAYLAELKAKRKEILDAHKDTADDTELPTESDILDEIEEYMDEEGNYYNNFGVTDHYDGDRDLELKRDEDFVIHEE